jgi:hypothetical protein
MRRCGATGSVSAALSVTVAPTQQGPHGDSPPVVVPTTTGAPAPGEAAGSPSPCVSTAMPERMIRPGAGPPAPAAEAHARVLAVEKALARGEPVSVAEGSTPTVERGVPGAQPTPVAAEVRDPANDALPAGSVPLPSVDRPQSHGQVPHGRYQPLGPPPMGGLLQALTFALRSMLADRTPTYLSPPERGMAAWATPQGN